MLKHKLFQILLGLTTLLLASCVAYISVIGLVKIYAGVGILGIVIFSIIELSKIVGVTYIQRYWKYLTNIKKFIYILLVVGVMAITSFSVYGFLMGSYQATSTNLNHINSKVQVIETKKEYLNKEIGGFEKQINFRDKRINSLSELRSQQEVRLDTLYQRKDWKSYQQAKDVEKTIKEANNDIDLLNVEISKFNGKISLLTDSISNYEIQIIDLQDNDYISDLGPLLYLSKMTGKDMDKLINIPTIVMIFLLDPFAIALLIAFNHIGIIVVRLKRGEKDEFKKKKPKKQTVEIVEEDVFEEEPKPERIPEDIEEENEVDIFIKEIENTPDLNDMLNKLCENPSNINEHLLTLKKYASNSDHITELRTDSPNSIFALLAGKPNKLISYDKIYHRNIIKAEEIAKLEGIEFVFVQKSVIEDDIKDFEQTDLLFIDVGYDYNQLIRKLSILQEKVNKFIIIHDTETEDIWKAIEEFIKTNDSWVINKIYKNNNGLVILKNKK